MLRRLAAAPPVRKVLTHPRVEPLVVRALPATTVRELPQFVTREFGGSRARSTYRVRGTTLAVEVRHGTPDVAVLGEIFYERVYEPPPPVAAALRAERHALSVIDLGSNIGLFGLFVRSEWPSARVTAFEPDPANVELLRRNVERNAADRFEIVEAAASNSDGLTQFAAGGYSSSHVGEADGGATVEVRRVDVLPLLARADYVKIDIEGAEWPILGDSRFESISARAVVLEYHPFLSPDEDARAAARDRLARAGFDVADGRRFGADHGMLWAWRG